jgi:capsular exopolysaccharide synthesis family protein
VSDIAGLPLLARVADVQSTTDLPLAGTGVHSAEAGKHGVPLDGASSAEAYRVLCANLQVTDLEQQIRTILVTSATRGDGKTTIAANLAMTLASSGFKTLLVDADLRRPTLHRFFGLSGDQGLADLAHPDPGPIETYLQQTFVPNLRFLASGSVRGNASELLAARTIVQRLAEIRALADFVVFDGPPVLVASGSLALAPQVDGILLVAGAGHSRFTHVQETRVMLERVGARIVGVVLNRVREPGLVSYEHESGDGGDPIASADVSVDANGASTLTSSSKR